MGLGVLSTIGVLVGVGGAVAEGVVMGVTVGTGVVWTMFGVGVGVTRKCRNRSAFTIQTAMPIASTQNVRKATARPPRTYHNEKSRAVALVGD